MILFILVAVATPKTGVTKVGLVERTTATVPVLAVTPVPPLATAMVVPFQVPVVITPELAVITKPLIEPIPVMVWEAPVIEPLRVWAAMVSVPVLEMVVDS